MAKVKNRRDNHDIKRPKSSAGYKALLSRDEKFDRGSKKEHSSNRPRKSEKHFEEEKENKNIL